MSALVPFNFNILTALGARRSDTPTRFVPPPNASRRRSLCQSLETQAFSEIAVKRPFNGSRFVRPWPWLGLSFRGITPETGPRAEQIDQTFKTFARRYGLDGHLSPFDFSQFHPPRIEGQQLRLF
jgi:hypothetical protein